MVLVARSVWARTPGWGGANTRRYPTLTLVMSTMDSARLATTSSAPALRTGGGSARPALAAPAAPMLGAVFTLDDGPDRRATTSPPATTSDTSHMTTASDAPDMTWRDTWRSTATFSGIGLPPRWGSALWETFCRAAVPGRRLLAAAGCWLLVAGCWLLAGRPD